MSLAQLQQQFIAELSGDDDTAPGSTGMAIYRGSYRARLLDALASGYDRTSRWVGAEAFESAAAHYILAHPPHSWTLDLFGANFSETLAALFPGDPEVPELAWLEWQMQQAFAAPDRPELTAAALGSAGLGEEDWVGLRFAMAAGFTARAVRFDLAALWHGLSGEQLAAIALAEIGPQYLIVWRRALQPHFRLLDPAEWTVLEQLTTGAAFGAAAELAADPQLLGNWLGQWLNEGLFAEFSRPA